MYNKLLLFVSFAFVHIFTTTARPKKDQCQDDPLLETECTLMRKSFGDKVCKTQYHHIKTLMSIHCPATCGLCRGKHRGRNRAFAPPIQCRRSRYGCCWDGVTDKYNSMGTNCPACVNRHGNLCFEFRWMCGRSRPLNDFIKLSCPITCGYCIPKSHRFFPQKEDQISLVDIFRSAKSKLRKLKRHIGDRRHKWS